MAKSRSETKTAAPQHPVRAVKLAGECPNNPDHKQTGVYKTAGKVRFCKCNDCGETWKIVGDPGGGESTMSEEDQTYLRLIAESLATATPEEVDGVQVVRIDAAEVAELAAVLARVAA